MGGAYAFFGFGSSTAYDGTLRLHRERKKRHEALPVSLTSGVPLGDVRDLRPRAHVRGPGVYETATQRPHDLRPRAHRNRSRCVKKPSLPLSLVLLALPVRSIHRAAPASTSLRASSFGTILLMDPRSSSAISHCPVRTYGSPPVSRIATPTPRRKSTRTLPALDFLTVPR